VSISHRSLLSQRSWPRRGRGATRAWFTAYTFLHCRFLASIIDPPRATKPWFICADAGVTLKCLPMKNRPGER